MAKTKNPIPVLKSDFLFETLKNTRASYQIAPFQHPGSIPCTKNWGQVVDYPDRYEWHDTYVFHATLEQQEFMNNTHGVVGFTWRNTDTGAVYFQDMNHYMEMIKQNTIVNGIITGNFDIVKTGYVYTLQWLGKNNEIEGQ